MIPAATRAHYAAIQALQAQAIQLGRLGRVTEISPLLVASVIRLQTEAAEAGATYAAMTLAEQGQYTAPLAVVDAAAFAGYASDGRALASLLATPGETVKFLRSSGKPALQAFATGRDLMDRIMRTQIADVARQAAGADIVARQGVGYVRMLNPPSCDRCTVQAGKWFRWNAGFLRHPQCFPAGVITSGPALEAATRRWYEGKLIVLTTASGQELPLTGNHPVLTSRGWVAANLIREGDEVVRSTRPEGALPLVVPNHHEVPARIEDVWGAFAVAGLHTVESTPEDFHGDGQHGEVDIVRADSSLDGRDLSALAQHAMKGHFTVASGTAQTLNGQSSTQLLDLRDAPHARGLVGRSSLLLPFSVAEMGVSDLASLAHGAALHTSTTQDSRDRAARDFVLSGEGVLARPRLVSDDNLLSIDTHSRTRWDAPTLPDPVEQGRGYAALGLDLLHRLAGQVELDRVVFSRSVEFRGHVFSLTSSEGWHSANSLIVSNCDCVHVASKVGSVQAALDEGLIQDPYEAFKALSAADQDRLYGKTNAAAIRDGADISQVVNARRGMTPNGNFTTEGTTKRGNAAANLKPGQRRMTPELIYRQATSRAEALALLEHHGYLLPGGQVPTGALRGQREGFGQLGGGGQREGAVRDILAARESGIRDPRNRNTMTAAERRLYDAEQDYLTALSGISPYSSPGFGNTPDPYGQGLNRVGATTRPVTQTEMATAELHYRRMLATGGQKFIA